MIRDRLEPLHEFWAHRHWLVKFLIVFVVLAALGALAGRPAYRRFVEWRCERNLSRADEALRSGRSSEARDLAIAVTQLRPGDIEAVRLAVHAMEQSQDPRSGDGARILFHHPEATDEDRRYCWARITERQPLGPVGRLWHLLGEEARMDPGYLLPFIDRLIDARRFTDAAAAMEGLDLEGTNAATEQRVLLILTGSGVPEAIEDAQQRLLDRIDRGPDDIAELLPVLDDVPQDQLHAPLGRALVRWLGGQASPGVAECLGVARFQVASSSDDVAAVRVDAAVGLWAAEEPAELAAWLLRIGRAEKVLELASTGATGDVEVYRSISQALAGLGRWDELLEHLGERPLGLPELEWFCDQAIAAEKCGDSARQAEAWANAEGEAGVHAGAGAWLELADLARAGGLGSEAEAALLQAVCTGRGPLPLYEDLGPLAESLYQQGKAQELLDISAAYLSVEPWNPAVLNQYCYLSCLYGQVDAEFVSKTLEPCRERFGQLLPVHCTAALAALRAGDHPRALKISDVADVDWTAAAPAYRIIRGIALTANDRPSEAQAVLDGVSWEDLMPIERKVFSELLGEGGGER